MSILEGYLRQLFDTLQSGVSPERVIPLALQQIQLLQNILSIVTPDELATRTSFGDEHGFNNSLYDYVIFALHDNTQLSHIQPLRELLQQYEHNIVIPLTQKILDSPNATSILNKCSEAGKHDTINPIEGIEPTTDVCGIRGMYQTFGSLFAHGFFDTMILCLQRRRRNPGLFYIPRGLLRNIEIVAGALREVEDAAIISSLRRLVEIIERQPDYTPGHYFFPEYCTEESPMRMYSRTNPPIFTDDLIGYGSEIRITEQTGVSSSMTPEYGPFNNSLVRELAEQRRAMCELLPIEKSITGGRKRKTSRRKSRRRKSRKQRTRRV